MMRNTENIHNQVAVDQMSKADFLSPKNLGAAYRTIHGRFLSIIVIFSIYFIFLGTITKVAVIYKFRRAEFGVKHQMLGVAMKQNQNSPSNEEGKRKTTISYNRFQHFFNRISSYTSVITSQYGSKLFGLNQLIDFHGLMIRGGGQTILFSSPDSGTMRTPASMLLTGRKTPFLDHSNEILPDESVCLRQICELKRFLEQRDIDLFYVMTPWKDDEIYLTDNRNLNAETFLNATKDKFLRSLKREGIQYFDSFEEMEKIATDPETWFYKTDHHWRIERAFELMPLLSDRLRSEYHLDWPDGHDFFSNDKFAAHYYRKCFLGSSGRKVGRYFAGTDDFVYYTPLFSTDYDMNYITTQHIKKSKSGSFDDTLCVPSFVESKNIYKNRYAVYWGDDYPEYVARNNKQDKYKVMILKDSMGIPFSAFLSLLVHETILIDLRYTNKDDTFLRFVEKYRPDLVLIMYNPNASFSPEMFNFGFEQLAEETKAGD